MNAIYCAVKYAALHINTPHTGFQSLLTEEHRYASEELWSHSSNENEAVGKHSLVDQDMIVLDVNRTPLSAPGGVENRGAAFDDEPSPQLSDDGSGNVVVSSFSRH
ncbi:Hypothetical protein NTJ_02021 [Nesidiocoris tenuis]|uniref:Uncharacterized protein n=1 Tax=Nesidiocoris tenuis TaxID=355587 RepID=A0ABN7AA69_9HEMI|nr:Hypothetical protein NTJ_02021 [Nesidiocoris tenuis]